eukprot:CAMPEP_0174249724 /NCGR_PEP_ID=MMETSP0439-20130205/65_1 /TAXON_ID=0 /ORGANISM="Stereomyxa ramosa, Strain Chinc5" /LENGTH=277 /DNA_ID=CAMNT_0015329617 /DNA_START=19 /DNA_END=852 /DNA_ORIENTATION=+
MKVALVLLLALLVGVCFAGIPDCSDECSIQFSCDALSELDDCLECVGADDVLACFDNFGIKEACYLLCSDEACDDLFDGTCGNTELECMVDNECSEIDFDSCSGISDFLECTLDCFIDGDSFDKDSVCSFSESIQDVLLGTGCINNFCDGLDDSFCDLSDILVCSADSVYAEICLTVDISCDNIEEWYADVLDSSFVAVFTCTADVSPCSDKRGTSGATLYTEIYVAGDADDVESSVSDEDPDAEFLEVVENGSSSSGDGDGGSTSSASVCENFLYA